MSKLLTEAEVVGRLESGMTIGIGGWGSRRKPMSIVRAIARSDLTDLTIVSYAGPDLGLLCAMGKVRRAAYAFASLDSIPLEPHFRAARQAGAIEDEPYDEGLFLLGLQAAAWRVPFLPTRVGLGSDLLRLNPRLRTVEYGGETLTAAPALDLDAAICHLNVGDDRGNAAFLGPDLYFDDLFLRAATGNRFISVERVVPTASLAAEAGTELRLRVNRLMVDGVVLAPGGAHFTSCLPEYDRDEAFQREYAASAKSPEAWAEFRAKWVDQPSSASRADVCAVAIAECFRGDGEILANPIGTIPMIGGRLARASFEPDLMMTDGEATLVANDEAFDFSAGKVVEAYNPYRSMFDVVWWGRRHVIMGASQIDAYGNQNFAAVGSDYARPKAQLLGFRGAPGNTVNNTTSYWVPNHSRQVFVEKVDVVTGVGYDRAAEAGTAATRYHEVRRVVTNLCTLDFETPDHHMRLRSLHPGVTVDEVVAATGFALVVPDDVPASRLPTDEELRLLYEVIDPAGLRDQEVPNP